MAGTILIFITTKFSPASAIKSKICNPKSEIWLNFLALSYSPLPEKLESFLGILLKDDNLNSAGRIRTKCG